MGKMQLTIEIDEEDYESIKNLDMVIFGRRNGKALQFRVINAIRNGKPLPKGHGALKDVDAVFNNNFPKANIEGDTLENMKAYPYWKTDITGLQGILNEAQTIIEADKAESEEDDNDKRRNHS